MADDLDKKLKQIADMFGVSDTSGLRNIVESIAPQGASMNQPNNTSDGDNTYSSEAGYNPPPPPPQNYRSNSMDMNLMAKASEMISMFNNVQDSRITLLNSVQPFLRSERQQRLGGAIQLLKIIATINTIAPVINRNNKG